MIVHSLVRFVWITMLLVFIIYICPVWNCLNILVQGGVIVGIFFPRNRRNCPLCSLLLFAKHWWGNAEKDERNLKITYWSSSGLLRGHQNIPRNPTLILKSVTHQYQTSKIMGHYFEEFLWPLQKIASTRFDSNIPKNLRKRGWIYKSPFFS